MIEPIARGFREWQEDYSSYGVTKFLWKDGSGDRGIIVLLGPDKRRAVLVNGAGLVVVEEQVIGEWPREIASFPQYDATFLQGLLEGERSHA